MERKKKRASERIVTLRARLTKMESQPKTSIIAIGINAIKDALYRESRILMR